MENPLLASANAHFQAVPGLLYLSFILLRQFKYYSDCNVLHDGGFELGQDSQFPNCDLKQRCLPKSEYVVNKKLL